MGKKHCCRKYLRKPKACKSCPLMAGLSKKKRRKVAELSRKLRKIEKAA